MKNRIIAALLATVMVVTLSACGAPQGASSTPLASSQAGSDQSSGAAAENVEIRFTWWGDTGRHEVYNGIADRFETANPNIKVVREPNSWADYWDKLATQVAGGNAPDVIGMHPQFASDYASRGALLDLQPYIDDGTIDVSKMSSGIVEGGKIGDLMCMISQGVTLVTLYANMNILNDMGIEVPASNEDWTLAEFEAAAKAFTDAAKAKNSEVLFSTDWCASTFNDLRYYSRLVGEEAYTVDGNIGFTEKTVLDWFTYWKNLRDYGAIPDAAASTEEAGLQLELKMFTLGKAAIANMPANQMTLYAAQMPGVELRPLRRPIVSAEKQGVFIEGAHNSVYTKSTHPAEAAKFINFFTNTEDSLDLLMMQQGIPANEDMANFIKPKLNEVQGITIDFVNSYLEVATGYVYPPKGATEVEAAYKDAGALVAFGQKTPEQAARDFTKLAQEICDRNK